ncbi:hypothetical protein PORCAN_1303 [Porphyromonas crevioricanis JCM 13913]|nr:hypothetical protein PORCAN_1303 [Porphyromonas crevioricanis JCM 13913]
MVEDSRKGSFWGLFSLTQNTDEQGVSRGSKISPEKNFANTGENNFFLRREFLFSPQRIFL